MRKQPQVRVLTLKADVQRYLPSIQAAADSDRNALGFFPASVYQGFAAKSQIFVAVYEKDGASAYAGHLLFTRTYPRAHVRQIYCLPEMRRFGIAHALINELKNSLTHDLFLSIYARVAEDLEDANRFWESVGFHTQRVEVGGNTRNRMIVVKVFQLNSPQLFPAQLDRQQNPLGLVAETNSTPSNRSCDRRKIATSMPSGIH